MFVPVHTYCKEYGMVRKIYGWNSAWKVHRNGNHQTKIGQKNLILSIYQLILRQSLCV